MISGGLVLAGAVGGELFGGGAEEPEVERAGAFLTLVACTATEAIPGHIDVASGGD